MSVQVPNNLDRDHLVNVRLGHRQVRQRYSSFQHRLVLPRSSAQQ
jgi:hypothetical protein